MQTGISNTGWIIIGVVVLILVLGLVAWGAQDADREDGTATSTAEDATLGDNDDRESDEPRDMATARTEARRDLLSLQAQLELDQNYEAARTGLANIRARLQAAYQDAGEDARTEWNELSTQFATLETRLRAGTSDALSTFADLIARLGADVRTETEAEAGADANTQ